MLRGVGGGISTSATPEIRRQQKIQQERERNSSQEKSTPEEGSLPGTGRARATRARSALTQPFLLTTCPPKPSGASPPRPCVLTFDEEEKAHYPHGCHDGPRNDEGQAPARGHPVASNQGAQNVAHRGVGVPDPHNQTSPATQQNTRRQMALRSFRGPAGAGQMVPRPCERCHGDPREGRSREVEGRRRARNRVLILPQVGQVHASLRAQRLCA